jgi:hypothetical protein
MTANNGVTRRRSASSACRRRRTRHRRDVGEAVLQLCLDLLEVVGLRLEIAGVRPPELGLERAANAPVGVAEMVVDGRIDWLELDRALELLDRLVVVAEPEPGPSRASRR